MNYVEPIRDLRKRDDILAYLKRTNPRDYIMFQLGFFTGLRISDILLLRVKDVRNKKNINLREKKTANQRLILQNKELQKDLEWYCGMKEDDEYLIKSREGENKPITRDMALKIVKRVCDKFEVENVGTHTLRKTFGYHFYMQTKDVVVLQKIFNHSAPSVTLRYIGIVQDSINEAMKNFSYSYR